MKRLAFFLLAGIALYGCSNSNQKTDSAVAKPDQNQIVITNDMDNAAALIPSWINEVSVIKMENGPAHSGEYVSKVDDKSLYTYTYREVFENINQKLPKRVVVNGWVSSPDPSKELGLIMDISENNQLKIWRSYSLANVPETPTGWYEFTAYFPIDEPIQPGYSIKIFGYSGKKVAYFDDFKITFEY